MIIEIPGCDFRIKGDRLEWQIQYEVKRSRSENTWEGRYFFPALEHAVSKAYELALASSPDVVDISTAVRECRRVKDELLRAVKRANAGAYEEKDLI